MTVMLVLTWIHQRIFRVEPGGRWETKPNNVELEDAIKTTWTSIIIQPYMLTVYLSIQCIPDQIFIQYSTLTVFSDDRHFSISKPFLVNLFDFLTICEPKSSKLTEKSFWIHHFIKLI